MEVLDNICAEYGDRLAKEVINAFQNDAKRAENLLIQSLGVLHEQGIYSFVLFCESRGERERNGAVKLRDITGELFRDRLGLIGNGNLLEEIRRDNGLASRLEQLMLAIQVLEGSLVYARFHAKALRQAQMQTTNSGGGAK